MGSILSLYTTVPCLRLHIMSVFGLRDICSTNREADSDAALVLLSVTQSITMALSTFVWQAICTSPHSPAGYNSVPSYFNSYIMTSQDQTILVFGPTGAVGCAAAIEAHRRGAHVWLAMRDTKKPIKGMSETHLRSERYQRVQADLSKPDTVKRAVQQSGATSAFVYTIFDSADNMRSTFDALRDAGVKYVVLLSSYTVKGLAEDERNMQTFIERIHAKTEVALKESGISCTAVRPMYFASNIFWYVDEIRQGKVQLLYPDIKFDYISPTDIGAVCGSLLSEPRFRTKDNQIVPLCGPELHTQREAMGIIGRTLGRKIEVQEIDENAWYEKQLKHMPRQVVETITNGMRASNNGCNFYPDYAEVSANVLKYAERESIKLAGWVQANKVAFE